ncbi:hypothetical protein ACFVR1_15880 [Psychrobacillus sp. NPDC058041]|uniref:hypothetical protein n=1 Tax=Psychrobacillus sp. NPDC058041 TaxID=3346310 RepID=UPI0036DDFF8B
MENHPLLVNVLPHLANRIKNYFTSISRLDILAQVDNLRIKELCNCGEPSCGSFYFSHYIENENENEDELEGFAFEGIGTIEVIEGKIVFVEIFPSNYGYEIRSILKKYSISY